MAVHCVCKASAQKGEDRCYQLKLCMQDRRAGLLIDTLLEKHDHQPTNACNGTCGCVLRQRISCCAVAAPAGAAAGSSSSC